VSDEQVLTGAVAPFSLLLFPAEPPLLFPELDDDFKMIFGVRSFPLSEPSPFVFFTSDPFGKEPRGCMFSSTPYLEKPASSNVALF
jgi:hypothetical protein